MSLLRYTSYREIDLCHVIGRVLFLGKEVDYFCPFGWKFLSWSKKIISETSLWTSFCNICWKWCCPTL